MKAYTSQYTLFETESRLCEMSLVIPVPESVAKKIIALRNAAHFGPVHSRFSGADIHVPVCSFLLFEHLAYEVFSHFKDTLQSLPPIQFFTETIFADSHRRSIRLGITQNFAYTSLLRNLDHARKEVTIRTNYLYEDQPMIPIFERLPKSDYEHVKKQLVGNAVHESFWSNQISLRKLDLLTKDQHELGHIKIGRNFLRTCRN